jgi:hypothetical protein
MSGTLIEEVQVGNKAQNLPQAGLISFSGFKGAKQVLNPYLIPKIKLLSYKFKLSSNSSIQCFMMDLRRFKAV